MARSATSWQESGAAAYEQCARGVLRSAGRALDCVTSWLPCFTPALVERAGDEKATFTASSPCAVSSLTSLAMASQRIRPSLADLYDEPAFPELEPGQAPAARVVRERPAAVSSGSLPGASLHCAR